MRVTPEEALRRGWIKATDQKRPSATRQAGPQASPKTPTSPASVTRKSEVEGEEQALLVKEFRLKYPAVGLLLIHIPNGGSRKNKFEGWRMKEQGVRAGVSDLLLPVARGGYFGLWIEFKAAPPNDAKVSDKQEDWIDEMRGQGYFAQVCLGIAQAMAVLDWYMTQAPTTGSQVLAPFPLY